MSNFKIAYACRYCGNIIGYKSAKAGETPYDVLLTRIYNLLYENRIRVTSNGEKYLNLHCSKCRLELGLHCLASEKNIELNGISLLQKAHLVVYDSFEVPFELPHTESE
ncbi:hypothetical protein KR200_003052 [Drosophila serrata]|nr:hypothetical protein KR200_003052 [Drosophila serrata]